jgi:hypothetical protein
MRLSAHGVQTEPSMAMPCSQNASGRPRRSNRQSASLGHFPMLYCGIIRAGTTFRPPNPKVFRGMLECGKRQNPSQPSPSHLQGSVIRLAKDGNADACNNQTAEQLMGRPSRRQLPSSYRVHYAGSSKSAQCSSVSHPALCPASLVRTQIGGFAVWGLEEQSWML